MLTNIRVAVLSDLHVGVNARGTDLCPSENSNGLEDNFLQTFLAFLNTQRLSADYLLLPGDVSESAQPGEVALASRVVKDVAKALRVPATKTFFVPGNHDVDWEVLKLEDSTGLRWEQRYDALARIKSIFKDSNRRGKLNLLRAPFLQIWESDDLVLVGYNSSWNDDPALAIHSGLVEPEHARALKEKLSSLDLSPSRLRIFMVHHHPILYSDPDPYDPDLSAMVNAEVLLQILEDSSFDLLIHGHKHHPRVTRQIRNSGFPLVILSAGSFSLLLDSRWSGRVSNQFHIIEVDEREEGSQAVRGAVRSWGYTYGVGWVPSQESHGIRHRELFGTYLNPNLLCHMLRPLVLEGFGGRDWVAWQSIVKAKKELGFLPAELVLRVLDLLGSEAGFSRHGDQLEDLVLLRR